MNGEKKSWRDVYQVHPAAAIYPMLSEDELREMGNDIKKNGLQEQVVFWSEKPNDLENMVLLDGRNRLDAMELVGMETVQAIGTEYRLKMPARYLSLEPNSLFPDCGRINPFFYAISKNVHRRHLTKLQKAELIVQAVMLEQQQSQISPSLAKSETRRFPGGNERGSSQDEFKQKVVDVAAPQGISQRTVERAIADYKGPTHKTPRETKPAPQMDIGNIAVEREAKKTIDYLEGRFKNLSHSGIKGVLTNVVDRFGGDERTFYRERLDEGVYHDPGANPIEDFDLKTVTQKVLKLLEPASELEIGQVINAIRQRFLPKGRLRDEKRLSR